MRAVTTFLWIRLLLWLATALTLLWAPLAKAKAPNERAWDPFSDLVFGTFVQWDAHWFLKIARDGYDTTSAAFFPLYPLVLHLAGSSIVTGTLVSLLAGAVAAWAVAEIAPELAADSVPLLALFPTAYVFTAVYSDALFLACSALAFLFAQRGHPLARRNRRRARLRDAAPRARAAPGAPAPPLAAGPSRRLAARAAPAAARGDRRVRGLSPMEAGRCLRVLERAGPVGP